MPLGFASLAVGAPNCLASAGSRASRTRLRPAVAEQRSANSAGPRAAERLSAGAGERPEGSAAAERRSRTYAAERWHPSRAADRRSQRRRRGQTKRSSLDRQSLHPAVERLSNRRRVHGRTNALAPRLDVSETGPDDGASLRTGLGAGEPGPVGAERRPAALPLTEPPLLPQRGRDRTFAGRKAHAASAESRNNIHPWRSALAEQGADCGVAVGNVAPVIGVMPPVPAGREVDVRSTGRLQQGQPPAVDLDTPRAKVQDAPAPERRDNSAADPIAPADPRRGIAFGKMA